MLNAGLRSDSFDNGNAVGESFISLDNQLAYRIGTTFDVNGDGSEKLGLFIGTYYLPIAANTNIRMAGAETYIQEYFVLEFLTFYDCCFFRRFGLIPYLIIFVD